MTGLPRLRGFSKPARRSKMHLDLGHPSRRLPSHALRRAPQDEDEVVGLTLRSEGAARASRRVGRKEGKPMSDAAKPAARKYDSFAEFYPFYLSEHSDRTCRRLHFAG